MSSLDKSQDFRKKKKKKKKKSQNFALENQAELSSCSS